MAKKLSQDIAYVMSSEPNIFDFRPSATPPVLLILDRRNDPVTPLLTQWTYQAMVHELLGITNGRVDLSNAPDIKDELKEIVISPEQDSFFARNLHDNFGDLGANVKAYVNEYQSKSFSTGQSGSGTNSPAGRNRIETIADMKKFVEEYPEFRKLGGNVSKHVALIGELSRLVGARRLLEVSELEQSLACAENHRDDLKVSFILSFCSDTADTSFAESARFHYSYRCGPGEQAAPNAAVRPAVSKILGQRNQSDYRASTATWRIRIRCRIGARHAQLRRSRAAPR